MRIEIGPFRFEVGRQQKAAGGDLITQWPMSMGGTGWWPIIREGFSGAWQRGIVTSVEDALTNPTFWACVTLISGDVSKLRPMLVEEDSDGVETETDNPAYSPVLRRPNHYQNRIQFLNYWIVSKLTRGNAYALKERDNRGVVTALYLLDPTRCRPMVTPSGDVYYALGQDNLSGVIEATTVVPARDVIHDTMNALYHPLCGLSPVFACGHAALQGLKIMRNTTNAAENGSMIGGLLVAPGQISEVTAKRLEDHWNANYTGAANAGKVAAIGDGLKFEKPNVMSAVDAQIIDQLKWGDEKICATFHIPPHMVAVGPLPSYNNVEALTQQYYNQCLQVLVETLELCLTEGLEMKFPYEVELDLEGLDRFDSMAKMEKAAKGVSAAIYSPNEGRRKFNLPKVAGGETPYLQEQNWPIKLLAGRELPAKAPTAPTPMAAPAPVPVPAKDAAMLLKLIVSRKSKEAGLTVAA